ncbi:hypothetical protein Trydic_g10910 [Trypoxylus dichotomus]
MRKGPKRCRCARSSRFGEFGPQKKNSAPQPIQDANIELSGHFLKPIGVRDRVKCRTSVVIADGDRPAMGDDGYCYHSDTPEKLYGELSAPRTF